MESTSSDRIIQLLKGSRARRLRLPGEYGKRMDVMEAIANNRAITILDLSECEVCFSLACLKVFFALFPQLGLFCLPIFISQL
jgi:hypothetical protein